MKKRTIIYLLTGVMLLIACTSTKNDTKSTIDLQLINQETITTSDLNKEQLNDFIHAYMEIKVALVSTNEKAASFAAENLSHEFKGNNDSLVIQLMRVVNALDKSKDIEVQRVLFENLSINLYNVFVLKGTNKQKLYKQYCPMAFEDQGAYWLSDEKEIYNPYFGDEMLRCGRVTELLEF